jgi:hypothetical protein
VTRASPERTAYRRLVLVEGIKAAPNLEAFVQKLPEGLWYVGPVIVGAALGMAKNSRHGSLSNRRRLINVYGLEEALRYKHRSGSDVYCLGGAEAGI